MSNEEKQLLFGEYASGNISPAGKRRLMAAALEDQDLFNAIAEQEELSELTVTLPADDAFERPQPMIAASASRAAAAPVMKAPAPIPPSRRNPWPFLFTGAVALTLAVTGVFLLRTQNEPKTEVAQAPAQSPGAPPKEVAGTPPPMRAAKPSPTGLRQKPQEKREDKSISAPPAQPTAQDQFPPAAAPPPTTESAPAAKSAVPAPARSREEAEPVVLGSVSTPLFQILRRGPTGDISTPIGDLLDGDALVVRYIPTQSGPIDLHNVSTNTTLGTREAQAGQTLEFPFTAIRGTMNLELRVRPPVAFAMAESRAASPSPAGASGGAANRAEATKDRKIAPRSPAPPTPTVRIVLTVH